MPIQHEADKIVNIQEVECTVLLLMVAGCFAADPLFFIKASDPPFGMYTANKDFAQETANWTFAVANVNRIHPAFLVVTGDLVNKTGDVAQIAEYLRISHGVDRSTHVYKVPGNHDVGNEPTPESIAAYRKNFGADYYSFREGSILALLHRYKVRYVFAGHLHANSFGKDGDLEMITTAAEGKPIGPDPSGLRIVEVKGDSLDQKYYSFGTLPNAFPVQ